MHGTLDFELCLVGFLYGFCIYDDVTAGVRKDGIYAQSVR